MRGRGLDAEVGGSLQVTGDPSKPAVLGGSTLRRGDFTLGGRRLVFSRGVITLDNLDRIDPMPDSSPAPRLRPPPSRSPSAARRARQPSGLLVAAIAV
jgi:hypothetical protein